jgi:signal transduction histidine kinase/CHASE3 domain sensor protein
MGWSAEKKASSAFAAVFVLLSLVRVGAHWTAAQRDECDQLVARAHDVRAATAAVVDAVQETRVHYRDYLLTGDAASRSAYQQARSDAVTRATRLRGLARENAGLLPLTNKLIGFVEEEVATLPQLPRVRGPQPTSDQRALLADEDEDMGKVRATLNIIDLDLDRALTDSLEAHHTHVRRGFWIGIVATASMVVLVLLAYVIAMRYVAYRNHAKAKIDRLNEDLRRRADELQTLLDVVPVGLVIAQDPLCREIRANRALAQMVGLSTDANYSLSTTSGPLPPYRCYVDGRELKAEEMPMQVAAATGAAVAAREIKVVTDDGRIARVCGGAVPLFDEAGRPRGAIGAFWDVADLHAAQQRLMDERDAALARSAAQDALLAEVAHDLRTPLGATLLWGKLMKNGPLDTALQARAVDAIIQSAEEETRLVDDLLDATRIAHGKLEVKRRPADLGIILLAAADVVRPLAADRSIELSVDLDSFASAPAPVLGDDARLRRVFWNLLTNAVKFTPSGGRIRATLERVPATPGAPAIDAVSAKTPVSEQLEEPEPGATQAATPTAFFRVRVTDTGQGISPDLLPHIFDRFHQGAGEHRSKGLGLGLSFVWHVVTLHGGTVDAQCDGADKGTTFTVTLPADPNPAPAAHPAPAGLPALPARPAAPRRAAKRSAPAASALAR